MEMGFEGGFVKRAGVGRGRGREMCLSVCSGWA